ncbi:type 4a pilus biogenesis protein PilO [Dactylosporangium sp. NPDC005555]|uniref:type 4a pilus biogenesis protein PilO n=1 Tax=Dactylosporangium sp. NPDC005555 TaxID=3154889 RepID=UPI0033BD2CCA
MRPERLWFLGGVVAVIVLLAAGFYLGVYPKYQEANDLGVLGDDTAAEVDRERRNIANLEAQNQRIAEYQTELKARLAALPETDSVAELLREVQNAGDLTGITVSGISVGSAVEVKASGPLPVHAVPVSLTASGPSAKVNPFLDQLQRTQPRALLVENVNVAAATGDKVNLTLTVRAFFAEQQ